MRLHFTIACLLAAQTARAQAGSDALARELADQIASQYSAISDFKATVLFSATLGTQRAAGKVKRYAGIRGHILYRKPADIRILGSDPLANVRIFDLVSGAAGFRLFLPTKKRFLAGSNDFAANSANKLENIRPSHISEVLLPRPVDPAHESMSLEDPPGAGYILRLPHRTLWIDGATLHVARELLLDGRGRTVSDARYSQWSGYGDVLFPKRIEIDRPQEEYKLVIQVQSLEINRRLPDEMFVLEQPPGIEVETLGRATTAR